MDVRKTWAFKRWADVEKSDPRAGQGPHRWIVSAGVFGLASVLFFYQLGAGSLHDWDEAIYAQVAREMLSSHNWTTLTWNGALFFHKPPLHFWLTALTYKMIGVSELAARLWPAIFGFGVVVLTFVLGMRLRTWVVGATAVLLLLVVDQGYYGYWWNFLSLARVGMLDSALTFWVMLALLLVWESEQRPRLIMLIGLPVGMAVMTKAWVGLLAAGLPVACWLIAGRLRWNDTAYWAVAILLASILILPWHIWQYAVYGPAFLHEYVGVHFMGRMVHAFEGNIGGALNYLDILRRGFSIWGYLWPLAYLWAVWRASAHGDRRTRLLLAWITIPLLLFSLAQTKLGWYISVIYPAIALLLGLALAELLTQRLALGVVAAVMFVCCLRLPVPTDGSRDVKLFALQTGRWLTSTDPVYVAQEVCGDPTRSSTSARPIMSVWEIRPSLRFYINRPLRCLAERAILAGLHPRPAYVIGRDKAWSHIRHGGRVVFEGYGFVLARWE